MRLDDSCSSSHGFWWRPPHPSRQSHLLVSDATAVMQPDPSTEEQQVTTYRMVYGDRQVVARETYRHIDELVTEDGWLMLFRGTEAILRVREDHVYSVEELPLPATVADAESEQ